MLLMRESQLARRQLRFRNTKHNKRVRRGFLTGNVPFLVQFNRVALIVILA